jgi:hypothetical protein
MIRITVQRQYSPGSCHRYWWFAAVTGPARQVQGSGETREEAIAQAVAQYRARRYGSVELQPVSATAKPGPVASVRDVCPASAFSGRPSPA